MPSAFYPKWQQRLSSNQDKNGIQMGDVFEGSPGKANTLSFLAKSFHTKILTIKKTRILQSKTLFKTPPILPLIISPSLFKNTNKITIFAEKNAINPIARVHGILRLPRML